MKGILIAGAIVGLKLATLAQLLSRSRLLAILANPLVIAGIGDIMGCWYAGIG